MRTRGYLCLLLGYACLLAAACQEGGGPVEPPAGHTPGYTDYRITPQGGTYSIDANCLMAVPAGAVAQDTTIEIARLEQTAMRGVFADYDQADFPAVAGLDVKPAGVTLAQPISFTFKSVSRAVAYVPVAHAVDLSKTVHTVAACTAIRDNRADSLWISVGQSGGYVVEALDLWPAAGKLMGGPDCREGRIRVQSADFDIYCGDENC